MVCIAGRFVSVYILCIGKEFMGDPGFAHNIITVTIAYYLYFSFKIQAFQTLYLSVVGGQYVFLIKAYDITFFVELKRIGINPV